MMVKDSKNVENMAHGNASTFDAQAIAFKAIEKRGRHKQRTPHRPSKLDNKEMALVIKSFRQILKKIKGKDCKPHAKRVCYRCGKTDH